MAAKKNTTASKSTKNGKSNSHDKKLTPVPAAKSSSNNPSSSLLLSMCVGLVALGCGLLTPPLLELFHQHSFATTSNNIGRSLQNQQTTTVQYPCNDELLSQYLHDSYVKGYHVLCFDNENTIQLFVGSAAPSKQVSLGDNTSFEHLKDVLKRYLHLPPEQSLAQPWGVFAPDGAKILDSAAVENDNEGLLYQTLQSHGMVLLFQGGQWLWPGVRVGFRRNVHLYSVMPPTSPVFDANKNRTVVLETLSLVPLVVSVQGFLSTHECQHIQEKATPSMEYSGVVLMDHDKGKEASEFRTSQSTFLSARKDPILEDIDYRTASLVRIPRNHQETVQVLRYGYNEHYDSHHDFFDASLYQSDPHTLRMIKNGKRNRLATVFWYLSNVEEGGETVFPRMNGGREKHFRDCETGLIVKPEVGKVIIFYSLLHDGSLDFNSLHGACRVEKGIKWAANKWVWNEKMGYTPS